MNVLDLPTAVAATAAGARSQVLVATLTDPVTEVWEDSSLIPLWTFRQATATRDTISGFDPDPSGRLRLGVTTKSP